MSNSLQEQLQRVLDDAFEVERELPPGGMSRLFLASERSLERKVVVKLLPPELTSEVSAQRFQREMLVMARLQHPHILPVLTAGARDGLLYYVTPYLAGESLHQRLARQGVIPVDEALRLLREVADALAFAHRLGVIHRDLKPDNVLLQHGHAVLADFGIARAVEKATRTSAGARLTGTGIGLGTLGYMAPEQLAGQPDLDARVDIYALGVVAYEMLAGRPPFDGLPAPRLLVAHMTERPEPITTHVADAPPPLAQLVMRCLEKEPANRWQTVDEMIPTLDELAAAVRLVSDDSGDGRRVTAASPAATSSSGRLIAGLKAFERREWHAAFAALSDADAERPLAPEHLEQLAEAAWWIGRVDDCIRLRERAYALHLDRDNVLRAAAVAMAVAEDCFHKLARSVARSWIQRAERHLEGLPESSVHGWMARAQAMLAMEEQRDLDRAWTLAQQALDMGRRVGDRDLEMLALQDCGRILVWRGQVAEGMAAIDEATAAATSGRLGARTSGRIFCNMMSTCATLADYRRAGEWNDAARRWCDPHPQSSYPGICRVHRAELLRLRGEWSEAEVEARNASAELEGDFGDFAAEAYYELGELRLRMGDLDAAEGMFRRAHEMGRDPVPGLALLRLVQGRADSARALIDRALSEPSLSPLARARLLPAQAEVALASGATEVARAAADELADIADRYRSPALAARAAFARGLAELAGGDPSEAAAALRRAWRLSRESDLPYEAARARVLLAQAYRACGNRDDAELELRAAAASFEKLGAATDARGVAALLES